MRKSRPVVIINRPEVGILNLRVIVPFTEWKPRYEDRTWMVRIEPDGENGLTKTSAADAFQVKSVSTQTLTRKVGTLSEDDLQRVVTAVKSVIE